MKLPFLRLVAVAAIAFAVAPMLPQPAFADRELGVLPGSAEAKQLEVRAQRFGQLWLSRRKRKIAPQLIQMLADEPNLGLRRALVVALGRLEDPQAEKPLRLLLKNAQSHPAARRDQVEPYQIRLALGRIKSRQLKGTAKLNAIAREVGKTWPSLQQDAQRLRVKLRDRIGVYEAQESDDRFIIEEFYDVLYRMGKRGENIRALGAYNVVLWPQQKPLLSASALSDKQESRFWIKRATPPSSVGLYPSHLLELGPQVPNELLQAMKVALVTAQRNPSSVAGNKIVGLRSLFIAAVATGDKRFIPILRSFTAVSDSWVKHYSSGAIQRLNQGQTLASIEFP